MIGGRDEPEGEKPLREPIDYEMAVRDLLRRRRRRRFVSWLSRIPDPRPSSPGQVVLAGLVLLLVGWIIAPIHVAILPGIGLLLLGFASGLIQPRARRVTWRNREMEIPPDKRWTDRMYYLLFRHA